MAAGGTSTFEGMDESAGYTESIFRDALKWSADKCGQKKRPVWPFKFVTFALKSRHGNPRSILYANRYAATPI